MCLTIWSHGHSCDHVTAEKKVCLELCNILIYKYLLDSITTITDEYDDMKDSCREVCFEKKLRKKPKAEKNTAKDTHVSCIFKYRRIQKRDTVHAMVYVLALLSNDERRTK